MNSRKSSVKERIIFSFITLLLSLSLFILIGEGICRLFLSEYLEMNFYFDERNLTYRHDRLLGWFPIENSQKHFRGFRKILVRHNNRGFRDHEHGEKQMPRIVFLGDSFVWGYDVNQGERFTERLQEMIPGWEVINLGVSGYGTDQEYLLIKQQIDYYRPEIVFLIFNGSNDTEDNSSNKRNRGYYKPYFVKEGPALQLKGVPVPKSMHYYVPRYQSLFTHSYLFRAMARVYFTYMMPPLVIVPDLTRDIIQEMQKFVEDRGATFIVALESIHQYEELASFYRQNNIRFLDVRNDYKYPGNGNHWNIAGHKFVSEKIYDYLKKNGLLTEH